MHGSGVFLSYPKKQFRLKPARGLAFDTPAHEVGPDFWTNGQNVLMRKGFAQRIRGYRAAYGAWPDEVFHIRYARFAGVDYWIVWGNDTINARDGASTFDLEGVALTAVTQPNEYASCALNGLPVMTNGLNAPRYWDGNTANDFIDLPGWPAGTVCKNILAFQYHLFALDITAPGGAFPDQILWSHAAAPGAIPSTWTPAANNEAGFTQLADTPGAVLTGAPMRNSLLLYKRSSTFVVDYVQDPDQVFTVRPLFGTSGALTRKAVTEIHGGQHLAVTDGDIILTDGANRRSVGQSRFREYLFRTIDQTYFENLFVVHNRNKGEVWICYPEAGNSECTKALVYDVANDALGIRDLPNVRHAAIGVVHDATGSEYWDDDAGEWDQDSSYWDESLATLADESLVIGYGTTTELQDSATEVAVNAYVEKLDADFGEPERVKFVRRVHVRKQQGSGTLYVRVGARYSTDDAITWSDELALAEGEHEVPVFALGRYISVRVRGDGTEPWVLTGLMLEGELRGYY